MQDRFHKLWNDPSQLSGEHHRDEQRLYLLYSAWRPDRRSKKDGQQLRPLAAKIPMVEIRQPCGPNHFFQSRIERTSFVLFDFFDFAKCAILRVSRGGSVWPGSRLDCFLSFVSARKVQSSLLDYLDR